MIKIISFVVNSASCKSRNVLRMTAERLCIIATVKRLLSVTHWRLWLIQANKRLLVEIKWNWRLIRPRNTILSANCIKCSKSESLNLTN